MRFAYELLAVWISLIIGVAIMATISMALSSWVISGANQVAESCENDPGYKAAHSRTAWAISADAFILVGAGILLVLTLVGAAVLL